MGTPEERWNKLLMPGEHMSFTMRPHWRFIVVGVSVGMACAIGLWLWTGWMGSLLGANARIPQIVGLIVVAVIAARWTVRPIFQWAFTRYYFTTERVMTRAGVITRRAADIPLDQISNIYYHQGVLDRLLGCGSLIIDSSGGDGFTITNVPGVERVDRDVHVLMRGGLPANRLHGPDGTPPRARSHGDTGQE